MLTLSRKKGQTIVFRHPELSDDIVVEVVDGRKGKVQLGSTAPDDVKILRGELLLDTETDPESRKAA